VSTALWIGAVVLVLVILAVLSLRRAARTVRRILDEEVPPEANTPTSRANTPTSEANTPTQGANTPAKGNPGSAPRWPCDPGPE
jgi:Na+-transporting methylmalonyl-CoA/oxaloacetate decarboxylase gamma subunit